MAIFEKTIRNKNFDKLLRKLEQEIRHLFSCKSSYIVVF